MVAPAHRGTGRQAVSAPPAVGKGEMLTVSPSGGSVVGDGVRYLGYGVMKAFGQQKGQLTRPCLRSPFEFTVHFRVRDCGRGSNERQREWDDTESLADALTCLGTLGGMGAKSRKGYGSLVLRSLTVNGADRWHPPQTMDDLRDALAGFRRSFDTSSLSGFPEYTAFSRQTRHLVVSMTPGRAREPLALLDLVGRELMRYRSWGHKGKVLDAESEKNFKGDHDLMKDPSRRRSSHPRRIAFGLPHNYGPNRNDQVGPRDPGLDRRASPLFIHIHQCGDDDAPVAVLSFLPARFLPKGRSEVSVGGSRVPQASEADLYLPIHEFLDRLGTSPRDFNAAKATDRVPNRLVRKEPFGRVLEVEP